MMIAAFTNTPVNKINGGWFSWIEFKRNILYPPVNNLGIIALNLLSRLGSKNIPKTTIMASMYGNAGWIIVYNVYIL
jgi:hypothetical protein